MAWPIVLGPLVMLTSLAFGDVFGEAEWIRDPVFEGVSVIDLYRKENTPKPDLFGPHNVHTYMRKELVLGSRPVSATAYVTGDDYYKLYVNGALVVQGPESGYPFAHPYYVVDVTAHLRAGTNCLAAHVYYQGLYNRVWNSADNRSGFILALDMTFEDGARTRFVTDGTWRHLRSKAFPTGRTIGYDTQFAEDVDMREVPVGWRAVGFDDSSWRPPLVGRQDHVFVEQATPPLQCYRVDPAVVKDKGAGRYFYDFGTEVVGHTRIRIRGEAGDRLDVRHGEELTGPDTVRYDMRANCTYRELPVLSGGKDLIEFYDYRAFRYIELRDAPSEAEVWVDVRHHPFEPAASRFDASDELPVRIWAICKNGVRYGAQGGFLDCPSREKGQYLGDALITGHSHLVLTADGSLTQKALRDFQRSQRICPGMMAVAPGSFSQEIAEYSLQWPMALRRYYWHTGDRAFVEEMVDAAFDKLYGYFARFEAASGLLSGMTEKWVLVDWPKNLRDGYDYEYAKERENTVLNAFYYESLRTAAALLEDLGRDGSNYDARALRVKQAFAQRLLNPATGLFVDAPGSTHSSLHANALPLCFGLVAPENAPRALALIREKRLSCGVYVAPFVIEACYRAGDAGLGFDLLTSRDEHSWHEMLEHGATTCMEAWGPDQKWNTSWCHPWSSSPIFLLSERVMGVTPAKPGWASIRFRPQLPAPWDRASLTIPIPEGCVTVRYDKETGFAVTAPPGTPVQVEAEGVSVELREALSHGNRTLTDAHRACIEGQGWGERVGDGLGVWVSVADQMFRLIRGGETVWQAACSTAAAGVGTQMDSFKTPVGWHSVAEKIGEDARWGTVFREKRATKEVWRPADPTGEDLVLTRVLPLAGEEPGKNQGGRVDSYARRIYIHGTNDEGAIGAPTSHGCIRLTTDDVIAAYERLRVGAPVLITE